MQIGIPKETLDRELRVALTPGGAKTLVQQGHKVWIESGAGAGAGFADSDYQSAGATVVFARLEAFARAEVVACVHAPELHEHDLLQSGQVVFAFWALPAVRTDELRSLMASEVTAVGLEAIEDERGQAPVLTAMSEIAGALAIIIGSGLLLNTFGGKGILVSGAPGVPPAHLVILGAGVLGRAAARAARGLGAQVTLLDRSLEHLRAAVADLGQGVTTMLSTRPHIEKALGFADLVLGAVAIHGQRAPVLITREMLRFMRPRSIVLDLSIDMGGCFETSRPTSFPDPVYEVDGILHFCVSNLPSVAARSSARALTNAYLPYLQEVANLGLEGALAALPDLRRGLYLYRGHCVRESLAQAYGLPLEPLPAAATGGG